MHADERTAYSVAQGVFPQYLVRGSDGQVLKVELVRLQLAPSVIVLY